MKFTFYLRESKKKFHCLQNPMFSVFTSYRFIVLEGESEIEKQIKTKCKNIRLKPIK